MKKRVFLVSILTIFVILLGIVLAIRIHEKNNPKIFKTNEEIQREYGVPVEVAVVSKRDIISEERFTGTVEGFSETLVLSDLTQRVIAMKVKVGQRVSRHDTIATLDKRSVSNMNLKYDQTLMAYQDAKIEFERMKNLYQAGAITKQAYDKARLNYKINKSNLEAITSAVFILSPIEGIVTETYVEAGDKINAGKPVARVVRFDKAKIKLQVNESEITKIKIGQKCLVETSSFDQIFRGKVWEISLSANPITRNFEVTVVVNNPDLLLRSGMFATVRIVFAAKKGVLAIHKDALMKSENDLYVYTVNSDSLITRRKIKVGLFDGQYYEVLAGLNAGELVIIEGQNNIQQEKQKAIIIASENSADS